MICDFGNVKQMRDAVNRLMTDEDARERLAAAGQERVQTLKWSINVSLLERTYSHWLACWKTPLGEQ